MGYEIVDLVHMVPHWKHHFLSGYINFSSFSSLTLYRFKFDAGVPLWLINVVTFYTLRLSSLCPTQSGTGKSQSIIRKRILNGV